MNSNMSSFLISPIVSVVACRFTPTPGWNRLTKNSPSEIEMNEATMNQVIARKPIRPTVALSPICAIPATIVPSTSGATSSLMRLRKMVDSSPKVRVRFSNTALSAFTPRLTA